MNKANNEISLEKIYEIYKKTIGYSLEKVIINDDGTTTHLHSDEFLENHPERVSSPEFTEEEENEEVRFMHEMVKSFDYGDLLEMVGNE